MSEKELSLGSLVEEMNAVVIGKDSAKNFKKMDSGETELGVLSEEMQRLWIYRERLRGEIDEITQHIQDLITIHDVDHRQEIPVSSEACHKFSSNVEKYIDKLRLPGVKYKIVNKIFFEMLSLVFNPKKGKAILGIREGFRVICRDDNARGDMYHPLDQLLKVSFAVNVEVHELNGLLIALMNQYTRSEQYTKN